jgi:hypothetical protein
MRASTPGGDRFARTARSLLALVRRVLRLGDQFGARTDLHYLDSRLIRCQLWREASSGTMHLSRHGLTHSRTSGHGQMRSIGFWLRRTDLHPRWFRRCLRAWIASPAALSSFNHFEAKVTTPSALL